VKPPVAAKFIVSHGIIKGKGLSFPDTNFVDKTLKPSESAYKTTFLVLSRIWYKICTRAWSPFPLIIPWKTMQVETCLYATKKSRKPAVEYTTAPENDEYRNVSGYTKSSPSVHYGDDPKVSCLDCFSRNTPEVSNGWSRHTGYPGLP